MLVVLMQYFAERMSDVFSAEETALLQHWNHPGDKLLDGAWRVGHGQHKPVAAGVAIIGFELIGHLFWRPNDLWKTDTLAVHQGHFA